LAQQRREFQAYASSVVDGVERGEVGDLSGALIRAHEVVARCATAPHLLLRARLADALMNKGGTLWELGRSEEAIAVFDDVRARFGGVDEPTLKKTVEEVQAWLGRVKRVRNEQP
jgi:hypothetical protein